MRRRPRISKQVSLDFRGIIDDIYSILLVSCFMWIGALDSSHVLLSHNITSLLLPITIILISTLI